MMDNGAFYNFLSIPECPLSVMVSGDTLAGKRMVRMTPLDELLDAGRALRLPDRLTDIESWHQHIPFAFALIGLARPALLVELGTHKGDSYSAFCQAIADEGLAARACAVDTWHGDEHAGPYSGSVFDDFRNYHDPRYGKFSTLMRMRFDDALGSFADGSIDLLHIDGLHTEAAVRHDFDTWLPKMSPRGVVLFHDTSVRERDFGVWKVWHDLRDRYPSFGFEHGHGLGLLLVGATPPAVLLALCRLDPERKQAIAELFSALGARIQHARREKALGATADALREQLSEALSRQAELLAATAEGAEELRALTAELNNQGEELRMRRNEMQAVHDSRAHRLLQRIARLLGRTHGGG